MAAVPDVPMTITGIHRCWSRSHTRAQLHAAFCMSGENSPPTLVPKYVNEMNIRISASRKLGVARPRKPTSVSPWSAQLYWWVAE